MVFAIRFAAIVLLAMNAVAYAAPGWLGPDGNNAAAVQALGEKGKGVRVGVVLGGRPLVTHEAFRSEDARPRVLFLDYTGENNPPTSDHDTWVVGVIAGAGGPGHEKDIGVAPEASVFCAKVSKGIKGPEDANKTTAFPYVAGAVESLVNTHNCRVIVTGLAFPDAPGHRSDGQSDWSLLYDYYASRHDVIFANPSGKQFRAPTIFGDSYNGITAGGLADGMTGIYNKVGSASNSGPTLDGRRKPDVVAPAGGFPMPTNTSDKDWYTWPLNDGATSFAAPDVGGVAALLVELAERDNEPNNERNVVIKAAMINSTCTRLLDKTGRQTDPNNGVTVWNPDRGFGRVDALAAWNIISAGAIHRVQVTKLAQGWAYDSVGQGGSHIYKIEAKKGEHFVCTVVWNRKVVWNDRASHGFIDPGELKAVPTTLTVAMSAPGVHKDNSQLDVARPNDNVAKFDMVFAQSGQVTIEVGGLRGDDTPTPYGLAFSIGR